MKFARNISLFIVLALIVTIGGVYAAWLYPADDAAVGSATKTFTGNMTQVDTQATSKGNISVETATDTLKIFVDDGGEYLATPKAQGSIIVCFTPATGVSESIATNGIPMEIELSVTGAQTTILDDEAHDVKIFSVKTQKLPITGLTKDTDGVFKAEISGQQILDCLNFCKDAQSDVAHRVTLETLAENQEFGQALNTYTINLTIKEASN